MKQAKRDKVQQILLNCLYLDAKEDYGGLGPCPPHEGRWRSIGSRESSNRLG